MHRSRAEELIKAERAVQLCELEGCHVVQFPTPDKRILFQADMDIDADAINGQHKDKRGRRIYAYNADDTGLDLLKNAGYPHGGYRNILVCGGQDKPIKFWDNGYYSKTAWEREGRAWNDPDRYLDGWVVPYIVVEGFIRRRAKGVVLGALAKVTNARTGAWCWAMVGDTGPLYKIGEGSPALARVIGVNDNARTGGESDRIIQYEIFPDMQYEQDGEKFRLMPMAA